MDNEVRIINPVNQVKKLDTLKDSYGFVSTSQVIDVFKDNNWQVVNESRVNTRKPEKIGYQRHLVKLENPQYPTIDGLTEDNKSRVQLCLLNAHDGSTAFRLFLGLLRMACLNGIIAGTAFRDFKACHSKNVLLRLDAGIKEVSESIPTLIDQVQKLQSSKFTEAALIEFLKHAVNARLKNVRNIIPNGINYNTANIVRRIQDNSNDAFTTMNRVQEALMRGGIEYSYTRNRRDDNKNIISSSTVTTRTRKLSSIQSQIGLNRLIYDKAIQLAA